MDPVEGLEVEEVACSANTVYPVVVKNGAIAPGLGREDVEEGRGVRGTFSQHVSGGAEQREQKQTQKQFGATFGRSVETWCVVAKIAVNNR
ncbi:MAG: hypothetical protein ACKPKO_22955, partial [Candidatus Fonsibacter sp.]